MLQSRHFTCLLALPLLLATGRPPWSQQQIAPPRKMPVLACGQVLHGRIDAPGAVDSFRFQGTVGDIVELTLVGDRCCVFYYARVFTPHGVPLGTFASDSLQEFTLPESGTYLVRVSAYSPAYSGSYDIGLYLRPEPCSVVAHLSYGDIVSSAISRRAEVDYFTFDGQQGDVVDVTLVGDRCCVFFYGVMFTPDGTRLASLGSDGLLGVPLPMTGTYAVRVTSFDLAYTGPYDVGVSCRSPVEPLAATLACGGEISGRIARRAQADYYAFDGQQGDAVDLTLVGDRCCVFFHAAVFAPSGALAGIVASDALLELALAETGTYVVRVTSYDLAYTGTYDLGFYCRRPLDPVIEHLSCGQTASSDISRRAEIDYFTFDGQQGDAVDLTLVGDRCCVFFYASLFAPSGSLLGVITSDSTQGFTLPEPGTYAVRVTSFDLVYTGPYTISLSCP